MKKNTDKILDAWLVKAAQQGDSKAFDHLLKRWHPKLLAYARSQLGDNELAQEASQDTLLTVSQTLTRLADAQAFPKWVYQILHRRCVDHIRNLQRKRQYESSDSANNTSSTVDTITSDTAGEAPQENGDSLDLQRAIQALDPNSAQVIRLFYFEGFNAKEMAEILNIPAGTVKSRLFTARNLLKSKMENQHD